MPKDEPGAPKPPSRWRRYQRPGKQVSEAPGEESKPAAEPTHGPERRTSAPSNAQRYLREHWVKITLVGGAALGVLGLIALIAVPEITRPDMFSDEGIQELADELEEETGSTLVYDLTIYPEYVVVAVPAEPDDPDSKRVKSYYWTGGGLDESSKTTTEERAFDLRELDGDVIGDAVRTARAELIEDPETSYAIVDAPEEADGYWIAAYVSNDYGEGGYLGVDLDGDEVTRTTW